MTFPPLFALASKLSVTVIHKFAPLLALTLQSPVVNPSALIFAPDDAFPVNDLVFPSSLMFDPAEADEISTNLKKYLT